MSWQTKIQQSAQKIGDTQKTILALILAIVVALAVVATLTYLNHLFLDRR